jgi:hypothetical protein
MAISASFRWILREFNSPELPSFRLLHKVDPKREPLNPFKEPVKPLATAPSSGVSCKRSLFAVTTESNLQNQLMRKHVLFSAFFFARPSGLLMTDGELLINKR